MRITERTIAWSRKAALPINACAARRAMRLSAAAATFPRRGGIGIFLLTALSASVAAAQETAAGDWPASAAHMDERVDERVDKRARSTLDGLSPGRHTGTILAGTSLTLAAYGKIKWWQDGFRSRFTAVNEGWFGQDTYSGGADKLGHFYMTYASSRLLTRALIWDGASHEQSLKIAAWYTLGAFAAIEVLDGFSRKWRFSREDMLMNAGGIGAAVLLERNPELDRLLDLRLLYRPSREEGKGFDPFGDYSGQTYLMVLKLSGIPVLRRQGLLRFVEVAVGYGTRGYQSAGKGRGTRNMYVGLSLNLSELLGRAKDGKAGQFGRIASAGLEFVQIPGTALLSRHPLATDSRLQAPGGL